MCATADSQPCQDQDGNPISVLPTEAILSQVGSQLTLEVIRSGHEHHGRIAGDRFYLSSSLREGSGTCDFEIYGDVLSDDVLTFRQEMECSNGAPFTYPATQLTRIE